MLRYLTVCFCCTIIFLFAACSRKDDIVALSENEVYFFYQDTCPHCHTAAQYIHENHPNLKIKALNVKMPGNMRLFEKAANTYNIGNRLGTPLICFGKNYIMGWNADDIVKFDALADSYENK